jgi:hypothetical protein
VGDCLLLGNCRKLQKYPTFWLLFPRLSLCIIFDKNLFGYIWATVFHKHIWSPCFNPN